MTPEYVISLGRETLYTAMILAAPVLLVGLTVGLVVALFQAVTSVQEQALSLIPKMLAIGVALVVLMPWMIQRVLGFTSMAFYRISTMGG